MSVDNRRSAALSIHKSGDLPEAGRAYRDILAVFPEDGQTWHYLAVLSGQSGRHHDALTFARSALRFGYETASVHTNIVHALAAQGDPFGAGAAAAQALRFVADDLDQVRFLAPFLRDSGRERELLACMLRHTERSANDCQLWTDIGGLAAALDLGDIAISAFEHAIPIQPREPQLFFNLATILMMAGKPQEAEVAARRGLAIASDFEPLMFLLTQLRGLPPDDPLAKIIENRQVNRLALGPPYLSFAKAKLFHNQGLKKQAIDHYRMGNATARSQFTYNPIQAEAEINQLTSMVADGVFKPSPDSFDEPPEITPVFIVGLPRSGSTLLAQVLARHSRIVSGGEMVWLQRLVRSSLRRDHLTFPQGLAQLEDASVTAIRTEYLRILRDRQARASHVIDKLPANLLSIPLITRLFPFARVIVSVRDPLETGWSCYKTLFAGPQHFAYDLAELGGYQNVCSDLIAACALQFPQVRIARHEEVLSQLRAQIGALLGFLDLEWENGCLDTNQDNHLVATASALQVRAPITAVASSDANNYIQWLQPLSEGLKR